MEECVFLGGISNPVVDPEAVTAYNFSRLSEQEKLSAVKGEDSCGTCTRSAEDRWPSPPCPETASSGLTSFHRNWEWHLSVSCLVSVKQEVSGCFHLWPTEVLPASIWGTCKMMG